jgi:superfamily II DNA or RNA helicase/ParB-like chromosome segregation protein Spo0J
VATRELKAHPLADLFPLLQGKEFESLVADIKAHGLREPVVLLRGKILDGRNRYRACREAGGECRFEDYSGADPLAYVISLNLKRRHLDESQRAFVAAKLATMKKGRPEKNTSIDVFSQSDAAALLNVSVPSVQRASEVRDHGSQELQAAVENGEIAVSLAAKLAREDAGFQRAVVTKAKAEGIKPLEAARQVKAERIEARQISEPSGKYRIIYADPPWKYGNTSADYMGEQRDHYPTRTVLQTLVARGNIPPADLVIIDEAHRWYTFYGEWMAREEWRRIPFIGLSATPWTKGLGKHYDDLLIPVRLSDLIAQRILAPFRVFAPSHPDLSKVRTVAGDYHEGDLSKVMNRALLTADIVQTWLDKGERRPTLLFAVDCAHAQSLCERFKAAGVRAEYADQKTKRADRTAIGKRLESGETQVVCNVGIFTTGTDWPFVSCIVLARPTKSEMLYLQMLGRGLRTCTGKTDLLVLDHSDTTLRLGFITDIHHEELDDGKPKAAKKKQEREQPLPKECPKCGILKPARVRKCPNCAFEAMPQSSEGDGELAELVPGKMRADKATKQRWWSMLTCYAKRRGFKEGWAAHAYREKMGVWPRGLADVQTEPDVEVMGYIKHKLIRHAKAQRKAA